MTAITTTSPTIVRTSEPPPAPASATDLAPAPAPPRFSGVCSPFAAAARAGVSSAPARAAAKTGMSARIRMDRGDPGWGSPSLSAARRGALARGVAMFESQLVHHRAAEQDDRERVEPDQHDEQEHERRADAQGADVREVEREGVFDHRHGNHRLERAGPDAAPGDGALGDAPVDQAQHR